MNDMPMWPPRGFFDYAVVAISVVVVLLASYLCIRYFFRPGEKQDDHIKKKILDDEVPGVRKDSR